MTQENLLIQYDNAISIKTKEKVEKNCERC